MEQAHVPPRQERHFFLHSKESRLRVFSGEENPPFPRKHNHTEIYMKNTFIPLSASFFLLLPSCENPADSTSSAEVSEAKEEASASGGTEYRFTDASTITFVGSKVTGSHEGGFKKFDGSFTIVDGNPVAGEFKIDMASTWADDDKLTAHLKSEDFFHVSEYPQSTFKVTQIEEKEDSIYQVSGNLTLHGVTKNLTFPTKVDMDGDLVNLTAEFDINRFDFDIKYPGKQDDLIRKDVVLKLDLEAKKESDVQA
jgi:polyisoprenoid-binding protein YceI